MGDATKLGRAGEAFGEGVSLMRGPLRRGAQEIANETPLNLRSALPLADDLVMLGTRPGVNPLAPQIYNPALVPDSRDLDNAQDAGRMASQRLNATPAVVAASNLAQPDNNAVQKKPGVDFKPVDEEGAFFKAAAPVMNVAESASNVANVALMGTDMVLPVLSGAVGWAGKKLGSKTAVKAADLLDAPNRFLNPKDIADGKATLGTHINNGVMAGFSALSAYGVAKGFSAGLNSLKHMNEAITGQPADQVSTMALLTSSNVPDTIKHARRHLLQEHVLRGGANLVGLGLIGRAMMHKRSMDWKEFLIPTGLDLGVNIMMGESALPYFAGVANAHKAGEKIPPQAYGEFLLAASTELKKHGPLGYKVAMSIGQEAAAAQTAPALLLAENEANIQAHKHGQKGPLDARIDRALAKINAGKAAKGQVAAGGHAEAGAPAAQVMAHAPQQAVAGPHVTRLQKGAVAQPVEVLGTHTGRRNHELTKTGEPDIIRQ